MSAVPLGAGYWRLWSASALSNLGDGIRAAALPLLAAALTRDPVLVAGVAVAQQLPWLTFGLVTGAVVDRADRRRVLIVVNGVRTILLGALVVAILSHQAALPLLYALAFAVGVGETLHDTAAQVAVPALVHDDQLDRANGGMVLAQVAGNELIGPPLGGALFALGVILPFITDSGLLALSAMLALGLPVLVRPASIKPAASQPSLVADIVEGLRWLAGHRVLRTVTALGAVLSLADAAWFPILVLYAGEILGLGPMAFGLLLGSGAAGGLAGGLLAARIARAVGSAAALVSSVALTGAAQLVLGLTSSWAVAVVVLALSSLAFAVWNVVSMSLRQSLVPDRLLGRVNSAYRTLVTGAAPIGALLGGALASLLGLRMPFLAGVPLVLGGAIVAARVLTPAAVARSRRAWD